MKYAQKVILERWLSPACRQAGAESIIIMFFVYILKSTKDNGIYVGKTNNLTRRIYEHNNGFVQSTKSRKPFIILEAIECQSEIEARLLEKEYKKGYKREEVKRKYNLA